MARKQRRPEATAHVRLDALQTRCWACDRPLWVRYHGTRTGPSKVVTVRVP